MELDVGTFLLLFSLLLLTFFLELIDVFGQKWEEIPFAKRENIGCTVDYAEGRNRYMQHLIALDTSFNGMRVGLDCANGSSWNMAKQIFDALGTVSDIEYAIDQLGIDDDMMVLAGDNVLDFSLTHFLRFCQEKQTSCVMRYWEENVATLPKRGVLEIDGDRLIGMEEKPARPKTQWCCLPFYYYTREDSKKIGEAIADGCGVDAPGSFIAWLLKKSPVYAMNMPGKRYDIGDIKSYEMVKDGFKGII